MSAGSDSVQTRKARNGFSIRYVTAAEALPASSEVRVGLCLADLGVKLSLRGTQRDILEFRNRCRLRKKIGAGTVSIFVNAKTGAHHHRAGQSVIFPRSFFFVACHLNPNGVA